MWGVGIRLILTKQVGKATPAAIRDHDHTGLINETGEITTVLSEIKYFRNSDTLSLAPPLPDLR
jgi:hypothetical protein